MSRLTVTTAEVATFALASLISSKGLIVSPISGDLTDDEFVEAADAQLATNRANCAGMDQVASGISAILASTTTSFVCQDQFDDDCDLVTEDASTLLTQLGLLVQISSLNIEDVTISSLAAEIITLIESITILSFEQEATLISLTATIQFTVFIYVSQISIIESAKLEIAGALAFPGATITIDQVDAVDKIQQEAVLTAQLTNLFQIEDANDRVIECIATIEGLPAAADPAPAQTSVEEGRLSLLCVEHQSLQWRRFRRLPPALPSSTQLSQSSSLLLSRPPWSSSSNLF